MPLPVATAASPFSRAVASDRHDALARLLRPVRHPSSVLVQAARLIRAMRDRSAPRRVGSPTWSG